MKASVLRYAAIGMATLSLAGFAAASTVSLGTTGPDSNNQVDLTNSNTEKTENTNVVGVANFSAQGAVTGDVDARRNTTVEDLSSGAADNSSSSDTSVSVSNASAGSGAGGGVVFGDDDVTIDTTGPDSNNEVTIDNSNYVKTENTNVVEVVNLNLQYASSGDVDARRNTTVGNLSSGDATNTSSTTTTIDVSNE
jgi:hypothetical protein